MTAPVLDRGGYDGGEFARTPPANVDAEQCVLGGMMLAVFAAEEALSALDPDDYYRPAHALVHRAIAALRERREPADAVTVAAELARTGELGRVGGAPYLHTLIASIPTAANTAYYVRLVQEAAVLRRAIELGTRIVQWGYDATGEQGADLVAAVQREAAKLTAPSRSGMTPPPELLNTTLDAMTSPAPPAGVPTGFSDLDALLGGLEPGRFYVIGARPGAGKSTLASDFARAAAIRKRDRGGRKVLLHSLEMTAEQVMTNIICAEARVSAFQARNHELNDEDVDRIARVYGRISEAEIWIDDNPHAALADMAANIAEAEREGTPYDALIIDYVQLARMPGKFNSRQEQVSEFSRGCKLLAKDADIPVVACAQLNRGPEARADKVPMMSDLRESGALEQDADAVILIHREDMYDRESPRAGEADLIVTKNRGGPTATVTVAFQGHFSRFVDMAPG